MARAGALVFAVLLAGCGGGGGQTTGGSGTGGSPATGGSGGSAGTGGTGGTGGPATGGAGGSGGTGGSGGVGGRGGAGGTGGSGGAGGTSGAGGTGAGGRGGGVGTGGTGGAGGRGGTGGTVGTGGTGGVGGGPSGSERHILYVAFSSPEVIGSYEINPDTGDLADLGTVPTGGGNTWWMVASPDKKFLYAASRNGAGTLSIFAIDPATGKLSGGRNVPAEGRATTISIHPAGTFLALSHGAGVVVHRLLPDGGVMKVQDYAVGNHGSTFHPSGKWLYAADTGGSVEVMNFDAATGMLSKNSTTRAAGPRTPEAHPNGKYLYTVSEGSPKSEAFAIDQATGAVTLIATPAWPSGSSGAVIEADTTNGWVYSTSRSSSGIWANPINADGAPDTGRQGASYPTGSPVGLSMGARDRFLFVAHSGGSPGDVTVWRSEPARLTHVKDHPFAGSGVFYVLAVSLPR